MPVHSATVNREYESNFSFPSTSCSLFYSRTSPDSVQPDSVQSTHPVMKNGTPAVLLRTVLQVTLEAQLQSSHSLVKHLPSKLKVTGLTPDHGNEFWMRKHESSAPCE